MKRLIFATLLILLGTPSWAGWYKAANGTGPAIDRVLLYQNSYGIYASAYKGTSLTNAIKRIGLDFSVQSYNGQSGHTWGQLHGIGGDSTNIFAGGGGTTAGGAYWAYYSALPAISSWTNSNSSTGVNYADRGCTFDAFGGASTYGMCVVNTSASPDSFAIAFATTAIVTGKLTTSSDDLSPFEMAGCAVNSGFYIAGVRKDAGGDIYTQAVNGSGTSLWDFSTSTGQFTGSWTGELFRQCATDGTLGIIMAYDSANTQTVIVGQTSAGAKTINAQTLSGDIRPCVGGTANIDNLGAAVWAFSATGTAYKSTGGNFSTAASYNITPDGGDTIAGCISTTLFSQNRVPLVTTAAGDVWVWTPSAAAVGGRAITGTGPFR